MAGKINQGDIHYFYLEAFVTTATLWKVLILVIHIVFQINVLQMSYINDFYGEVSTEKFRIWHQATILILIRSSHEQRQTLIG